MSRDIADRCRATSWIRLGLWLVVAGGVEGQGAEDFSVGVEDPDVERADEEQDSGAGVGAADADVVESTPVAQCDGAGGVDAVVANAVVRGNIDWCAGRAGFDPGVVGGCGCVAGRLERGTRPASPSAR
jgi:hypothetical protein